LFVEQALLQIDEKQCARSTQPGCGHRLRL
jgi:hypothetical protein